MCIRDRCQHCENPECVKVCPTEASHVAEDGTIQIDKDKCIGCQSVSYTHLDVYKRQVVHGVHLVQQPVLDVVAPQRVGAFHGGIQMCIRDSFLTLVFPATP